MSRPAPYTAQAVSTIELRAALERALNSYFGTPNRIVELRRRPSAYSTSFVLEELDVHLDDGMSLQLIFKDLSWRALLESARRVKPAFIYNPLREIETYRTILAPNPFGAATYYGAAIDHQAERYWLFLEKVPGLELYQVGDLSTWQQVARWLAAMHARFAGEVESLAEAAPLLSYDEDFCWVWIRRAQAFFDHSETLQPKGVQHNIRWLARRYDRVVERLMELPTTLIHGEFYASNVLVQERAGGVLRVCPVDWEMAAVGPGLIDLAALTAGGWTAEEKTALALAYHTALAPHNGWPPAPDVFLAMLDCCRLHLAIQWLGWSSEWSPPPEHAQNWLGEALSLAEKLGL